VVYIRPLSAVYVTARRDMNKQCMPGWIYIWLFVEKILLPGIAAGNDPCVIVSVTVAAGADCVARLCHLKAWPDFAGFGFNLHADRATPGQYIGKVDDGSPAEAAGLRLHDRIVEVNGSRIDGKSHAEVVACIKSVAGEVRLLVVDAATDEFFRNNGVQISSASVTNVHSITCPDSNAHCTAG